MKVVRLCAAAAAAAAVAAHSIFIYDFKCALLFPFVLSVRIHSWSVWLHIPFSPISQFMEFISIAFGHFGDTDCNLKFHFFSALPLPFRLGNLACTHCTKILHITISFCSFASEYFSSWMNRNRAHVKEIDYITTRLHNGAGKVHHRKIAVQSSAAMLYALSLSAMHVHWR